MASRIPPLKVLKAAMKEAGFTDSDGNPDPLALSRASGVDVSLCRRYLWAEVEIGEKNAPRLAQALGIQPGDLVWGRSAA
jgi:hypothetical protein